MVLDFSFNDIDYSSNFKEYRYQFLFWLSLNSARMNYGYNNSKFIIFLIFLFNLFIYLFTVIMYPYSAPSELIRKLSD
jgi:hypothetical protein